MLLVALVRTCPVVRKGTSPFRALRLPSSWALSAGVSTVSGGNRLLVGGLEEGVDFVFADFPRQAL